MLKRELEEALLEANNKILKLEVEVDRLHRSHACQFMDALFVKLNKFNLLPFCYRYSFKGNK